MDQKDVVVVGKDKVPAGRASGAYVLLKEMGQKLEKDKALQVKAKDAAEAKKLQNRWRAYFKKEACTRRDVQPDGSIMVYLWRKG